MDIIQFIDAHDGLFLDILTAVYVIATMFITWSNLKSAKASRAQLEEDRRQYYDKKRLDCLPFLVFETLTSAEDCHGAHIDLDLTDGKGTNASPFYMRIKNIGNGSAVSIKYGFKDTTDEKLSVFPFNSVMNGDYYDFTLNIITDDKNKFPLLDNLKVGFCDLLGNDYKQKIVLEVLDDNSINATNLPPKHQAKEDDEK